MALVAGFVGIEMKCDVEIVQLRSKILYTLFTSPQAASDFFPDILPGTLSRILKDILSRIKKLGHVFFSNTYKEFNHEYYQHFPQ